ncbi:MAG: hypothetical protein K8R41_10895 [Bacteroidales bacterium]|nr:hypothetical protein [Bacteroidales bacterium]
MKKLVLIFVIPFLIISCSSPKKTTNEREHSASIVRLVNKLKIYQDNQKNIQMLSEELAIADKIDLEKIEELRISGQPDIWHEIFIRYSHLKYRQNLVKKLPVIVLEKINFKKKDYSNDIESARMQSANYLYAISNVLLEKGDDSSCMMASENLFIILSIYEDFRDVDKLIRRSLIYGSKNVLYRFYNNSEKTLPNYQKEYLRSVGITENSFFDFDNNVVLEKEYDLSIVVNIERINVLPGATCENSYYVSKGTKEKATKYRCKVIEADQEKSVKISGVIEYYDNINLKQLYSKPFTVKTNFSYKYVRLKGDERACSPEIIELAKRKIIVYPSDNKMLEDAVVKLKALVETLILAD